MATAPSAPSPNPPPPPTDFDPLLLERETLRCRERRRASPAAMAFHRRHRLLSSHDDSGYNNSYYGGIYYLSPYSDCANASCLSPPAPSPSPPPAVNNGSLGAADSPLSVDLPISLGGHGPQHVKAFVLIIAVVLAACFLLLTYYAVLLRFRTLRRRRSLRSVAVDGQNPPAPEGDGGGLLLAGDEIHHVWYIRTVGLDENTIGSITVCPYKKGDGLIESTDCSVCLSEFHDGELVRLLPKCSHAFHIACIDTWLRSHVNCPLCRAPIVAPTPPPAQQPPQPATIETSAVTAAAVVDRVDLGSSSSNAASSSSSSVGENSQIVLPPYNDANGMVLPENSRGGDGIEIPVSLAPPPHMSEIGFRVQSDLGDSAGRQADHNNDWVTIDLGSGGGGIQPIRRSFSMDTFAISGLFTRTESESSSCHDRKDSSLLPTIREKQGSNGTKGGESSPQKNHPSDLVMNRSLSSSSGRFFLSRFARGRGNSILPMREVNCCGHQSSHTTAMFCSL